jgi:hypothetical protein
MHELGHTRAAAACARRESGNRVARPWGEVKNTENAVPGTYAVKPGQPVPDPDNPALTWENNFFLSR